MGTRGSRYFIHLVVVGVILGVVVFGPKAEQIGLFLEPIVRWHYILLGHALLCFFLSMRVIGKVRRGASPDDLSYMQRYVLSSEVYGPLTFLTIVGIVLFGASVSSSHPGPAKRLADLPPQNQWAAIIGSYYLLRWGLLSVYRRWWMLRTGNHVPWPGVIAAQQADEADDPAAGTPV